MLKVVLFQYFSENRFGRLVVQVFVILMILKLCMWVVNSDWCLLCMVVLVIRVCFWFFIQLVKFFGFSWFSSCFVLVGLLLLKFGMIGIGVFVGGCVWVLVFGCLFMVILVMQVRSLVVWFCCLVCLNRVGVLLIKCVVQLFVWKLV